MTFVWLAEYPNVGYAAKDGYTLDPNKALQFRTEAECQQWCDANEERGYYEPREHGFMRF